ncbi:HflC protein [Salinisphaera shabanensis T35B1]|jgi:membrane protease subunit HflC|uniref:Membrane anchored FtsH modulator component 2 HflC protein n=1 Tax=Salinisphaera shabanensis E1L3A TaxID=1033802 RepID=A0ACB4V5K9_9GAMM|nr:protease modulator HflC [Salinisphaera shabanensis]ERJ18982.1 Membrane anchored FtsH modulator component 2 HflC protein [Salinisphaera shabanensis E1L3A]
MSPKHIFAIIVVLIIGYTALDSAFIVDERERVVVVELGEIVGQNYEPGLHFKIPFIQTVHSFDRRVMTFTEEIERVLTSENKNLAVDFYVKWRINDTVDYYLSTQGQEQRTRDLLTEIVENDLLAEFSKRTIRQAVGDDRNEIVAAVQVQANQDAKELGVEIEDVRIMRLDLPEEVSESVYERMRSERQEVIRTLRAQGDAAAQEIRSDAERERTIILADAYSQGQVIRGEGDARAAELYANAYQANPTFYSFYRSLQLYRDALGSDDLMLLRPDGQLFRYFNPSASNAASSP